MESEIYLKLRFKYQCNKVSAHCVISPYYIEPIARHLNPAIAYCFT